MTIATGAVIFLLAFLSGLLLGTVPAALFLFMLAIIIPLYVYNAFVIMTIAKKTKTKNEWLAWVPIGDVYLMTRIAKVPAWLIIFYVLSVIPVIGILFALFAIALVVLLWWKIAEARKMPGWYGLLMLIPIVNFIMMGIIAWNDKGKAQKTK